MQNKQEDLTLNLEGLTDQQTRTIKSLMTNLTALAKTNSENDYFECSKVAMQQIAFLIKIAQFAQLKDGENLPYSSQAVEFSLESVQECLTRNALTQFDN